MPIVLESGSPAEVSTLGTALEEFYERGFQYLNESPSQRARAVRWINQAHQAICSDARWPFTEATATGPAPLTLNDLSEVESVRGEDDRRLQWLDRRTLISAFGNIDQEGQGRYWHIENGVLKTWPSNTELLKVRYHRAAVTLSVDSDQLLVPSAYLDIVIDGAVIRAYKDSDNFEALGALRQHYYDELERMRRTLLWQHSGPEYIVEVAGSDDSSWL